MRKYDQLVLNIKNKIESSEYNAGMKIPSIRHLAAEYAVSKSTVIKALDTLEREHLLYSVERSGYFVVKTNQSAVQKGSTWIDFASSAPDPIVFPYVDFQHCINQAIDLYQNDLFIYGTTNGLPSLLPIISKRLTDYQVFASPEQIVMTSGIQLALSILSTIPFPNGKQTILVEQPGYHLFLQYLEKNQLPVRGIQRTEKGLDLQELERIFREEDIRFFYTMPRFQNPLGTSLSKQEKIAIAALAEAYDVYIVEDDYLADLEFDTKRDPIYSYDRAGKVIYLKSFSKIIFPGLRTGAVVLPNELIGPFSEHKRLIDIDSSMLSQAALEIYLKSGMFERHRERMQVTYIARSKQLVACLKNDQGAYALGEEEPATHTHVRVDRSIPMNQLIQQLKKASVMVQPIDRHFISTYHKEPILQLNIWHVKEEEIARGVDLLKSSLQQITRY
ncbi:PLP-dependent aminotransferase family protein [Bacillus altitudinis]|uniref:aminotransferase-like domain-containing protein n=1 Tax=Bacillus altitudinis TaxID=293387 RepID=UPI00071DE042|nr:PLP-dependent aminotransferase family protein [Bacillus altitudinis]KSU69032.1 GntR family transcriptional regulator [Bacillus altitudinis]SCC40362.1 DNA-binding transcriptional regulator, MocR family, contains an aminotransferase domain [Bacillus altitudinis]